MRALTLTQPWAGLVASGIKLIENRPRRMIKREDFGKPFAIHASRVIDESVYNAIALLDPSLDLSRGQEDARWYHLSRITSAVIAVATIERDLHGWSEADLREYNAELALNLGDQRRWFFGPIGYVLRDVHALAKPVRCGGKLGFWTLDTATERAVMEQM